jgi:hypothetical protein
MFFLGFAPVFFWCSLDAAFATFLTSVCVDRRRAAAFGDGSDAAILGDDGALAAFGDGAFAAFGDGAFAAFGDGAFAAFGDGALAAFGDGAFAFTEDAFGDVGTHPLGHFLTAPALGEGGCTVGMVFLV